MNSSSAYAGSGCLSSSGARAASKKPIPAPSALRRLCTSSESGASSSQNVVRTGVVPEVSPNSRHMALLHIAPGPVHATGPVTVQPRRWSHVMEAEEEPMTLPILVTGGTGTLGQQVVARLRAAGLDVRILSRRTGDGLVTGDLATGQGLAAAVQHVGTIVHCASNRKGDAQATRHLVQATTQAATQPGESQPHLVYISIVGVDRFPRGYFKAKLEAERVVAGSGLPWTTLRATQFYELIAKGATRLAKLPVIPVPAGFVVQPVDSG